MTGRVNLIANTLTDTGTAIVSKGGSMACNLLQMGDDVFATGAIFTGGWRADAQALEDIKGDERAFGRVLRADALAEQMAAHAATKAKQS